jgi:predicted nucleotide-binding protein
MAKSGRSQSPPPRESKHFSPDEASVAKERLQRRIAELKSLDADRDDFVRKSEIALDNARSTVRDLFGQESDESSTLSAALMQAVSAVAWGPFDGEDVRAAQIQENAENSVQEAIARLENLVGIVNEKTIPIDVRPARTAAPLSRKVFLVHGHNEETKLAVARVLERLDLQPIILHEQPDMNRTIIEKFEAHSDVGFAVVLMTADDRGSPSQARPDTYKPRARQNVLLEMGFFLGRLGRGRVCVLYDQVVEMPSDYAGVLYKRQLHNRRCQALETRG